MTGSDSADVQEKELLVTETRQRFFDEQVVDVDSAKYDERDLHRIRTDDDLVHSFARGQNAEDAARAVAEAMQWRKEMQVLDLDESSLDHSLLELGTLYLHGWDKDGCALLWFRVRLHVRDAKTLIEKKRLTAFWLERHIRGDTGRRITVLFDMTDTGVTSIDMDFIRFIINCFKIYYPELLSKLIVYEMPWIMNAAWKIVKGWLGPGAVSMLKFVGRQDISDYIDSQWLPLHMGGSDMFKYTYPPLPDEETFSSPAITPEDEEFNDKENEDPFLSDISVTDSMNNSVRWGSVSSITEVKSLRSEIHEQAQVRVRNIRRPTTSFQGKLLTIRPAEELQFGLHRTKETKCAIVLSNTSTLPVAFKVKTTSPEKYRVKPSSGCIDSSQTVDILLTLLSGFEAATQDKFQVIAAEVRPDGPLASGPDAALFWKGVPRAAMMEHRLRCRVVDGFPKTETSKENGDAASTNLTSKVNALVFSSREMEIQIARCLIYQKVTALLLIFTFLLLFSMYISSPTSYCGQPHNARS
uniref:motile sperm domain-containing protein 2 isoform X1 n=1 Tax=Myxine glutinosa TaxID=7769 RepID=UPI00358E06CD